MNKDTFDKANSTPRRRKPKKSGFQKFIEFFIPQKNDNAAQIGVKIVSILLLIILIVAAVFGIKQLLTYKGANDDANKFVDLVSSTASTVESKDTFVQDPDLPERYLAKWKDAYKENNDIKGIITIPGKNLQYPVVQGAQNRDNKTYNNNFYLDHNIKKEYNPYGVPFMDYRAVMTKDGFETNTTIYGHAPKDGTFFRSLGDYKKVDYYKKNPIIKFDTVYGETTWKILGGFMIDAEENAKTRFNYHDFVEKASDDDVKTFVNNVITRSYVNTGIDTLPTDKFLTLSTCDDELRDTGNGGGRFVIVARKLRDGESDKIETANATQNENVKMPDRWYKEKKVKNPFK